MARLGLWQELPHSREKSYLQLLTTAAAIPGKSGQARTHPIRHHVRLIEHARCNDNRPSYTDAQFSRQRVSASPVIDLSTQLVPLCNRPTGEDYTYTPASHALQVP